MIAGLGIDICDLARIERAARAENFCRRVFTPEELAYAESRSTPYCHLAAMFAAREAFAKATGIGLGQTGLHSVSVMHDINGRPHLRIDFTRPSLAPFKDGVFHLSLSHDHGVAAAVVIYEKEEKPE